MMRLQAGELVEVRSKEEILATLDKSARLDASSLHAPDVCVLRKTIQGLQEGPQDLRFCIHHELTVAPGRRSS